MIAYIAEGRYYATQAEARKIDKSFEQVDIPTVKADLLGWLNNLAGGSDHLSAIVDDGEDEGVHHRREAPQRESWQVKRENAIQASINLDEAVQAADYDMARRLQSQATERMVELIAAGRGLI